MTTTDLNLSSLVDTLIDEQDTHTPDKPAKADTYVDAIGVRQIQVDHSYQRYLNTSWVTQRAQEFDPSLVGVIEVSKRPDGTYAVIDGQHRLELVRVVRGPNSHIAANIHTGLSIEDEARLFFDIDRKRRRLTGWDRWNARRGAGEPAVLDIENLAAKHQLTINPNPKPGHLRCVTACEKVVDLAGLDTLDRALALIIETWDNGIDALRAEIVHGVALVLAFYEPEHELDRDRLVAGMQAMVPRQVTARAAALRETHHGQMPRLVAKVVVDAYNKTAGLKLEPFEKRVAAGSKATPLFWTVDDPNPAPGGFVKFNRKAAIAR